MPLGGLATAGLIAAGVGAATGIGKGIGDIIKGSKIKPKYTPFQISESAKRMQGLAQAQLNARSPYAAAQQRGILGSQANAAAAVQRAVTDPSQAIAAAAGMQGSTNQALAQQMMQEQQLYAQRFANLMGAEQNLQQQEMMKFQADERKYAQDMAMKQALRNAGFQSVVGGLQNFAGTAIGATESGINFGDLFKKRTPIPRPGLQTVESKRTTSADKQPFTPQKTIEAPSDWASIFG